MQITKQDILTLKLCANTGQIEGLPKNPRLIKDERFEQLKQSIERSPEFLNVRELIVYPFGEKYVVIGGNQRLKAAKELKIKTLPCKVLDIDTPIEKLRELTIMDNNPFGENDNEILLADWDLQELNDWGALPTWGDLEEQGDNSLNSEAKEDDYVEPADLVCDVKLGDLIEIGEHRLLCGDSTKLEDVERLMNNQKADICLTDPPYGVKMDKGFEGFEGFGEPIKRRQYADDWDSEIPKKEAFDLIFAHSQKAIIFGGNFFAHFLPQSKHWIFWDKLQTMPTFGDGELAWTNIDRKSIKKITVQYNGLLGKEKERFHPTQKPIKLLSEILNEYSKENNLVLDTFLGSGSTMVAAHQLNRKCYGLELSEKYCQVIIDRMKKLDPSLVIKINGTLYEPNVPF